MLSSSMKRNDETIVNSEIYIILDSRQSVATEIALGVGGGGVPSISKRNLTILYACTNLKIMFE